MRLTGTLALILILASLQVAAQSCPPPYFITRNEAYSGTGCYGDSFNQLRTPCLAGHVIAFSGALLPCESEVWSCPTGTSQDHRRCIFPTAGSHVASGKVYHPFLESPMNVSLSVPIVYGYALGPATATEGRPDRNARITILRGAEAGTTSTVDYATSDGTAKAGVHYVATSGTLTFAAGEREKIVTVPLIEDDLYLKASFKFTISKPSMGQIVGNATKSVLIEDDEPPPQVGFETTEYWSAEGGTVPVTLVRAGSTNIPTFVSVGEDDHSNRVDFAAGEIKKTVDIQLRENTCFDGKHDVGLWFRTVAGSAEATPGRSHATVHVEDDEPRPTLSINDVSVVDAGDWEHPVFARMEITLSGRLCHDLSIRVHTLDGTATERMDYGSIDHKLTMSGLSYPVSVFVRPDTLTEPDETFFVEVTPRRTPAWPDELPTVVRRATVTIVNDDDGPAAVVPTLNPVFLLLLTATIAIVAYRAIR